ncbi:hypothetical protein HDV62DRAFT_155922 [Trichoderma sp. SZMC 28011]
MFGHLIAMRFQLKTSDGVPLFTTVNVREHRKTLLALFYRVPVAFCYFFCLSRHYIPFCEQRCLDLLGDAMPEWISARNERHGLKGRAGDMVWETGWKWTATPPALLCWFLFYFSFVFGVCMA